MQKTKTREAILKALEQANEPVNFEKLFESTKNIQKCSRKTFSNYLYGLTQDGMVLRDEITTRNVKYTINKQDTEKSAKIRKRQKEIEESLGRLLDKIKTFQHYGKSNKNRSNLITKVTDELTGVFEFTKAYTFFKTSGIINTLEMKMLEDIQNKMIDLASQIFKEIQKRDEPTYNIICLNLFLRTYSEINSLGDK